MVGSSYQGSATMNKVLCLGVIALFIYLSSAAADILPGGMQGKGKGGVKKG